MVNHRSFWDLLAYNSHYKTKDSDIPHRTKITASLLECAAEIQSELLKELQV